MKSSFTPLPSVCGSLSRAPASKTRRDGSNPAAVLRYQVLSDDRISRFGFLPERPYRTPESGASARLKPSRTTIIVVFLVRADRLSEVIMDDHRPTSSGGASLAELETGNARGESPGGIDRPQTPGVRTRSPGA